MCTSANDSDGAIAADNAIPNQAVTQRAVRALRASTRFYEQRANELLL